MKKILYLIISFLTISCIDDVKLDLKENTEQLVIDASINWFKGNDGKQQKIVLTKSTNFYEYSVPTVSGAKVQINDDLGNLYIFVDSKKNGEYLCSNFKPEINKKYFLTIIYKNESYISEAILQKTPAIEDIIQKEEGGVFGQSLEVKPYFQDNIDEENYYMFRFKKRKVNLQPDYQVIRDRFFNGNKGFGIFSEDSDKASEKLVKGDTLNIQFYGIDKRNYEFLNKLFEQIGNGGGNPFSTVPTNSVGNIINTTNSENFAYGYFRLSEVDEVNYVVK